MSMLYKTLAAAVCAAVLSGPVLATANTSAAPKIEFTPQVGQSGKDVIWVPTPQSLVDRMLDMAKLTPEDHLVDLGSGDGRTVITAAKRGATARGIEYNPRMVELSQRSAQEEGVADRAKFERADIFSTDFSNATVLTLFLLPELNLRLRPIILNMKPGTRVVSNSFNMEEWEPDETVQAVDGCTSYCNAYKWIVPAQVGGEWAMGANTLKLVQSFQYVRGTLQTVEGQRLEITEGRINGPDIRFNVGKDLYTGQVDGKQVSGVVNGSTPWQASFTR